MKEIKFIKAVASGNDFIIIDQRRGGGLGRSVPLSKLARGLCRRKFSVGADGLLLIEPSKAADFKMRVFNPDGTEVEMCGNGARCVALYAGGQKLGRRKMVIETRAGNLQAEVKQDRVKIKLSSPKGLKLDFTLHIQGRNYTASRINTGVPHVVCFRRGLAGLNVADTGRAIRLHPLFRPGGTNANFVQVLGKDHIKVRTYERGVEQETLACGTGCAAAAIIFICRRRHSRGRFKIKVDTLGGETLLVYFKIKENKIEDVYLEGQARLIFRGGLYV